MIYPPSQFTLLLIGFALATPMGWAEVDLQGLVNHSPFGEGKSGAGGERTGALEFRGYYIDNGITYFSIYNPSSKSSVWVAEGETSTSPFNVSVKNFDPEKNTVTLESGGQSMRLTLHEAVIVKMDLPAIPTTPPAGNNNAAPAAATAVMGSANPGQSTTPEQAQTFKDNLRQRWQDRQNQNTGNDNKNKNAKAADTTNSSTENNSSNSNQKNRAKKVN